MFDSITNWITSAQGMLSAILALILFAIAAYWQVMAALKKNNKEIQQNGIKADLRNIAIGAITDAETGEGSAIKDILKTVTDPALINVPAKDWQPIYKDAVATKITETKGEKLIKKLGKAFDVGMFVKEVYQSIKPAIKSLRKGK